MGPEDVRIVYYWIIGSVHFLLGMPHILFRAHQIIQISLEAVFGLARFRVSEVRIREVLLYQTWF